MTNIRYGQEWEQSCFERKLFAEQVEVPQLDVLLKRDPYLTDHQVLFTSARSSCSYHTLK